jgi:cytochrome P450
VIAPKIREKCDTFWLGLKFFLNLHNPEDVKIALNSEKCFEKSFSLSFFYKWGLLTIGGEKYKQQRKALNPLFTPSNLRSLIPKINAKATEFLENYADELEMKNADWKLLASKFTLNTVCKTLFNVEELDKESLQNFIVDTEKFVKAGNERFFKPWLYPDFIYRFSSNFNVKQRHLKSVNKIFEEHCKNHKEERNENLFTYFTCLKNFIFKMSMDEYMESTATFVFVSYDATAATIANAILLLAMNQTQQEKVYREVSSILNSSDDEEKINEMKYLDLVIKETLRLFPITALTLRDVTEDVQLCKIAFLMILNYNFLHLQYFSKLCYTQRINSRSSNS